MWKHRIFFFNFNTFIAHEGDKSWAPGNSKKFKEFESLVCLNHVRAACINRTPAVLKIQFNSLMKFEKFEMPPLKPEQETHLEANVSPKTSMKNLTPDLVRDYIDDMTVSATFFGDPVIPMASRVAEGEDGCVVVEGIVLARLTNHLNVIGVATTVTRLTLAPGEHWRKSLRQHRKEKKKEFQSRVFQVFRREQELLQQNISFLRPKPVRLF